MKRLLSHATAAALVAGSLTTAAPALAHDVGGHGPGDRRSASSTRSTVPSRVTNRLSRASAALRRAEERIDDGDAAKAVAQLAAVRRALSSASRSGLKHVVAGDDAGPATAGALLGVEHDIAAGAVDNFDGQDGDAVDALATTLDRALDARDEAVAAISALSESDQGEYSDVLDSTSKDLADELDAIDEALSDDTLTSGAKSALGGARTKVTATRKNVDARVEALGSSREEDDGGPWDEGPPPRPWFGLP